MALALTQRRFAPFRAFISLMMSKSLYFSNTSSALAYKDCKPILAACFMEEDVLIIEFSTNSFRSCSFSKETTDNIPPLIPLLTICILNFLNYINNSFFNYGKTRAKLRLNHSARSSAQEFLQSLLNNHCHISWLFFYFFVCES